MNSRRIRLIGSILALMTSLWIVMFGHMSWQADSINLLISLTLLILAWRSTPSQRYVDRYLDMVSQPPTLNDAWDETESNAPTIASEQKRDTTHS